MFLSRDEKIAVLLLRVEKLRHEVLFGMCRNPHAVQDKIGRLLNKVERLGGNRNAKIYIKE